MGEWKRPALVVLLGVVAILLQSTVLRSVLPEWAVPNLMLVVVVYLALHEASMLGGLLVFVLGLLLDMSSGMLIGPWAGAFIVVFGVLASLSQQVFVDSPIASIVVVFIASLTSSLVYVFMVYEFHSLSLAMLGRVLLEGVVTALVAWPVIRTLRTVLVRRETMSFARGRGR